jgi:cytochrome c peroxidase
MKSLLNRAFSVFTGPRYRISMGLAGVLLGISIAAVADLNLNNFASFSDPTGRIRSVGPVASHDDPANPFFQSLGTNGRSCSSCHQAGDGWGVTPPHIQERFVTSDGLDPIFRTNDGANCPSADVSTVSARRGAYSMLLEKGLIRVSLPVPAGANFAVTGINDPHNCAETTPAGLALFRRPLPSTNLPFLSTVMWDGRESFKGQTLQFNLTDQIVSATLGHAQAAQRPTDAQIASILNFELAIFTAQEKDRAAGDLQAAGGNGGPEALSHQPFFVGVNDPLGGTPPGVDFNPVAFTLFDKWAKSGAKSQKNSGSGDDSDDDSDGRDSARAAVVRGQALFNTLTIPISGVAGLNDLPGVPATFNGTCTTCHNTPNVGNHSVPLAINIGITDYPPVPALNISGLPVYTIHCDAGAVTPVGKGSDIQTTDPGRALVTGKCADIGKTKGPILRGLASRAPYFHNGSAATLHDAVNFYDQRFKLNLTEGQKDDLVAFLNTL